MQALIYSQSYNFQIFVSLHMTPPYNMIAIFVGKPFIYRTPTKICGNMHWILDRKTIHAYTNYRCSFSRPQIRVCKTATKKICDRGGIGIRARLRGVSERVRVQVPSIAPNNLDSIDTFMVETIEIISYDKAKAYLFSKLSPWIRSIGRLAGDRKMSG